MRKRKGLKSALEGILAKLAKITVITAATFVPLSCFEEPVFPAPHIYQSQPGTRETSYILKAPETIEDVFWFGYSDIDREAKIRDQPLVILKRRATPKIPKLEYEGRVWATLKNGMLSLGCEKDKRPFAQFRYDPAKEAVCFKHWKHQIEKGRVKTPLPPGYLPAEGVAFRFENNWDKLIEFDKFFRRKFDGKSLFSEEAYFKAISNEDPHEAINIVYGDIAQLKREPLVLKLSKLEDAVKKYQTIREEVEFVDIKTKKRMDKLREELTWAYSNLEDEYEDDPRLPQIKSILGIKEPEQKPEIKKRMKYRTIEDAVENEIY